MSLFRQKFRNTIRRRFFKGAMVVDASSSQQHVTAKYDYRAQEAQELDLHKMERLTLLDDSRNWWKVANAQVGF